METFAATLAQDSSLRIFSVFFSQRLSEQMLIEVAERMPRRQVALQQARFFSVLFGRTEFLYSGYRCLTSMFPSSILSSAHPASQVTCNAALSALARVGLWQSAAQWFEDMRLHRPLPDDIGTMASKNCRAGWTNLH